jgi:hypothetical protein
MFMSLIGCGYWLVRRAIPRVSTPVAEPEHRAARGAWTALDEHQLIRLLRDSAP